MPSTLSITIMVPVQVGYDGPPAEIGRVCTTSPFFLTVICLAWRSAVATIESPIVKVPPRFCVP